MKRAISLLMNDTKKIITNECLRNNKKNEWMKRQMRMKYSMNFDAKKTQN